MNADQTIQARFLEIQRELNAIEPDRDLEIYVGGYGPTGPLWIASYGGIRRETDGGPLAALDAVLAAHRGAK